MNNTLDDSRLKQLCWQCQVPRYMWDYDDGRAALRRLILAAAPLYAEPPAPRERKPVPFIGRTMLPSPPDAAPSEIARDAARDEITEEMQRAVAKFPTWPTDPLHALAVLGEEYGELTKAMLQLTYEPHKTSADDVRKEAVQTAAMALRLVRSLDRYEYARAPQHRQDEQERNA